MEKFQPLESFFVKNKSLKSVKAEKCYVCVITEERFLIISFSEKNLLLFENTHPNDLFFYTHRKIKIIYKIYKIYVIHFVVKCKLNFVKCLKKVGATDRSKLSEMPDLRCLR